VVERGVTSLKKANQFLNTPLTSLLDHLNNKTKSKKQGPPNVLIDENEVVIID